jgi:hypothetical protein
MKKIARFLLLMVMWLVFHWISYGQDWSDPAYIDSFSDMCQCLYQTHSTKWYLIFVIIISLLIFPSRKIFEKSGKKQWHSIIPFYNIHALFKINSSKRLKIISSSIYISLFFLVLLWFERRFHTNPIQEYIMETFSHGCCEWRIILDTIFRRLPLVLFVCFFLILLLHLYKLARNFGWKRINSILFALFFPIWVRILSFGNYEYIGNKESTKNLESI